jgi:hypothetical protein
MSQSKQQKSAAQRREQIHQRRLKTGQSKQNQRKGVRRNNSWPLMGVILVVVVAVIALFVFLAKQPPQGQSRDDANEAFKTVTTLKTDLFGLVGAGNANVEGVAKALPANAQVPKGPTGKPQFLYLGADYCPYCAAQRWAIIVTLSRFGQFKQPLEPLTSQEGDHLTYDFRHIKYSSQYIDFVALEAVNNQQPSLTAEQKQLITTYNSGGGIPFVLIGNKQAASGSYFRPDVLPTSYKTIADQVKDPDSDLAKGMIGAANYLTAAVCQVTENQPANVCTSAPIQQLQRLLPKATSSSDSTPLSAEKSQLPIALRRQE